MNDNNALIKFTEFFKWLSIILLIFSLLILLFNIVACTSIPFRFDIIGIENLIKNYSTTIQIFTYFLGTFAIWLTLNRMLQTKEQITLIEDNNRFNNYFLHREQFLTQFKDNIFFKEFEDLTNRNPEPHVMVLYNTFYYKSHNNFVPTMNKQANEFVDNYFNKIEKSSLNIENSNLNNIEISELMELSKLNNSDIRRLTTSMNSYLTPQMRIIMEGYGDDRRTISDKTTKFIYLNEIYWSGILYKSLDAFDGINRFTWDYFPTNFANFREEVFYEESKAKKRDTA